MKGKFVDHTPSVTSLERPNLQYLSLDVMNFDTVYVIALL